MEVDWDTHELRLLIAHHREFAQKNAELGRMLSEDDPESAAKFIEFARMRTERADFLEGRFLEVSRSDAVFRGALEEKERLLTKRWNEIETKKK